ncbi:MAG: TetR/AcrR family transcriptional regulator [Myxococcota bacterium]
MGERGAERAPSAVRDRRRGQIVAAGRAIVVAHGLEALTFAALEQALGFSRGVVTWHFANKDEVVRAVFDDAVAEIDGAALAAIRAEASLADRARAVVREMVHGWLGGSHAGDVLVRYWSRLRSDDGIARANQGLFERYRRYSAELVAIGQARGEFRRDVDPDAVGGVLVGTVLGIAAQAMFDPAVDPAPWVVTAGDAIARYLQPERAALGEVR